MNGVRIGCSGWSYTGWVGPFYPKGTKPGDFLRLYSRVFDAVEIDSTFYSPPSESTIKKWLKSTPEHFVFCPKMPQKITHENRLRNVDNILQEFIASIVKLKPKLGTILIQMPPSFSFERDYISLENFFSLLPSELEYAIEFRNGSMFTDSTYRLLENYRISLAWSEIPMAKNPALLTTDSAYLRLVGDRSIKEENFGRVQKDRTREILYWTEILKEKKDDISKAYVYSNNHFQGFGPATANFIYKALGLEERKFNRISEFIHSESGQKTLF